MTSRETAHPSVTVIIRAGERRRAVVPTLRSIAAAEGRLEVLVVVPASGEDELRRIVAAAGFAPQIVLEGLDGDLAAALEVTESDILAIVDAGDLVGSSWLAVGGRMAAERDALFHPASVLVFGRHTDWWRQPETVHAPLLPIAATWAAPVLARRSTMTRLITAAAGRRLEHVAADHDRPHAIVPLTTAFVRAWGVTPPWEVPVGELLPPDVPLRTPSPDIAVPRRKEYEVPGGLRQVLRIARTTLRPWRDGLRAASRRRRGLAGYPATLLADWRGANEIEPLVPFPRAEFNVWHRGRPAHGSDEEQHWVAAYQRLVGALPSTIDYLYFAPWIRMGGGDVVIAAYVNAVRRLDPTASVVVITTEPVESTRLGWLDPGVTVVELRDVVDLAHHRTAMVERVLPQLISQFRPRTLHAFNSTVGFDIVEQFGETLGEWTNLFLTSFAIDRDSEGERLSVMFLRRPGFLDPVSGVLVDSKRYVDTMVSEFGFDRGKFAIQNHVIELAGDDRPMTESYDEHRPLKLLWAGRFDLPKRLDVLAAIAEAVRAEALPVEITFYGSEVMGHPGLEEILHRLAVAGAVRRPPYPGFESLPLHDFDAYIMTSEWEGVPHTVLESMAAGIPVVAPLVGGVGEVLNESTGYPVPLFDDVRAYLHALRTLIEDPAAGRARAQEARSLVEREFSLARFESNLRSLPGYLRRMGESEEG